MGFVGGTRRHGGQVKVYPSSGYYLSATCNATGHSYGSWVDIIDPVPFDVDRILLTFHTFGAYGVFMADIGVGATGCADGALAVLAPELPYQAYSSSAVHIGWPYDLPIKITAGQRLAIRAKDYTTRGTATTVHVTVALVQGETDALIGAGGIVQAGMDGASTSMTEVDPGASAGTYGSYVELESSLAEDARGFMMCFGNGTNSNTQYAGWRITLAAGAASSEVVLVEDWFVGTYGTNIKVNPPVSPILPIPLKAGTRLSAKARCSINDATDRLIEMGLIGLK